MPGSRLSDRIGRKPIILGGTLFMAISTVTFGFSKTLSSMILSRCVGGAAGSVWVSAKTVMAESTDKSNQGKAFQLFTVWCVSSFPHKWALGGLLAHPERNFSLFRTKFWIEYPFVLPCFVAAGFAVFVVILGFFFLEEVNSVGFCLYFLMLKYHRHCQLSDGPSRDCETLPSFWKLPLTILLTPRFL